jgi:serpin B
VSSSVKRDLHPDVSPADATALVSGNTSFAFALYPGLTGSGSSTNVFYSPYSVSLALAMTYAGAGGDTATQMASALDFTLPAAQLHPAFDALDLAIETVPAGATGQDGQPFVINVADSLWGASGASFGQPFLATLGSDYGAGLHTVDFGDAAQAVQDIDAWVSGKTNGKIPNLLSPNSVNPETRFVIVNAVYFNASWATPFDATRTAPGTFTREDGSTVQASMMTSNATSDTPGAATGYASGTGWQAVDLPYSGGTTSMVVVLPDEGSFSAVEQQLSPTFYANVLSSLNEQDLVELTLPKFTIHGATVSLVPELKALGMTDAFAPGVADFKAIVPGDVFIHDVLHQAFVSVDESGTEAAAATAVVGGGLAIATPPPPTVTVDVNRPFFFFIRDVASGTVLFVGREGDPTAQ